MSAGSLLQSHMTLWQQTTAILARFLSPKQSS